MRMAMAHQINNEPARHFSAATWQGAGNREVRQFPICHDGFNKKLHETQRSAFDWPAIIVIGRPQKHVPGPA